MLNKQRPRRAPGRWPGKHRGLVLGLALVALLSGCAAWRSPAADDPIAIRYAAGACFGACPQFEYRIAATGDAWFEGKRFTGVIGRQPARGDAETFRRLQRLLAAVRPGTEEQRIGPQDCERFITDQPSVTVTWEEARSERRLIYNSGCQDRKYQGLRATLNETRQALPVQDLIQR